MLIQNFVFESEGIPILELMDKVILFILECELALLVVLQGETMYLDRRAKGTTVSG